MSYSIRRDVMRRVYVIFFLRTVVKPVAIKTAFAVAGVFGVAALVSVHDVFKNMPSLAEFVAFVKFAFYAFVNTGLAEQALSLILIALGLWAVRDLLRIRALFSPVAFQQR
jgi:hypothetical protein